MRDVVAQLTSLHWLDERRREEDAALEAAEQAYHLADLRYRSGVGNFLQVLIADGQVIAQRRSRAELDARANELDLNLVRALGGGYTAAPAVQASQASQASQALAN
jgi:outer membrane protein TolC